MTDASDRNAFPSGPVLLTLFAALFFAGALGGRFYALDFHQTFEPLRRILGRALRDGSLLWDGSLSNGMPVLANPLHAALYPPNWLFGLLPADLGLTLLTVAHVLFGALGAHALARRWGLGPVAAWGTAVVFGFNGLFISATAFTNLAWTQAWLPWLLLAWSALTARRGGAAGPWRFVALTVVVAAMLALGDPFVLFAGAIGLALLSLGELVREPAGARGAWAVRCLLRPLVALVPALLLAAPFLVAALRYLPVSLRGHGFVPEALVYWSFHPFLSLGLLFPGVFGDPQLSGAASFWAAALVPEKGFPLFRGLYIGGVPLALALVGAPGRGRRPALVGWLVVLVLLGLGRHTPLYSFVSGLPLFESMRYPMKWMLPATLPLALLAGFGIDKLADSRAADRARRGALFAILLTLGLAAGLSIMASPGLSGWLETWARGGEAPGVDLGRMIRTTFLNGLVRGAAPLLPALIILMAMRRGALASRVPYAFVALVAVDLCLANPVLAPVVPAEFYRRTPPALQVIEEQAGSRGRVYIEGPLFTEVTFDDSPEHYVDHSRWERESMVGYIGASKGLDLAFNMDVGLFRTMRYARLGSMVRNAPPRESLMLLGAAGVTHLVTYGESAHPGLELLAVLRGRTSRPQRVSRNLLALPRVRRVATLIAYEDERGFMITVSEQPDDLFARAALVRRDELRAHGIDADRLPPPSFGKDATSPGTATLLEDRGASMRIATEGPAGFLVVSDCMAPGWTASVDGNPAPLLLADYAFRAVPVPAGRHEVTLRYRPW